jgi:hypothetical protein
MNTTFYQKPCYKLVIYDKSAKTLGLNALTIKHQFGRFTDEDSYNEPQVSSWNIRFGMSKAISGFEFEIPDTGVDVNGQATGNEYADIDVFDYVYIWYGYTGSGQDMPTPSMFVGRIDTKKVELSERGYIRTFTGRDLGEVLFRTIMRRSLTGSSLQSYQEILSECGITSPVNQVYLNNFSTPWDSSVYFYTATGNAFDAISGVAQLSEEDFYVNTGSPYDGLTLNTFTQNSVYAPEIPKYLGTFSEKENIFKYTLIREVADVKNDVFVFGQNLQSFNSGSIIPLSKHEFTDNFSAYTDLSIKSFQGQWQGTLWRVTNNPDWNTPAFKKQQIKYYPIGYNIAHDQIGDPWPFMIYPLPRLTQPVDLGTSIISRYITIPYTGGIKSIENLMTGPSGSGTVISPQQLGTTGNVAIYSIPTGSNYVTLSTYLTPANWYALTLFLDLSQCNSMISTLSGSILSTGSDRTHPAIMLNSGDSLHITYGNIYNALNGYTLGRPNVGKVFWSSSQIACEAMQINDYEQWWIVLGSNVSYNDSNQIVPIDYFACAVEAPRLGYFVDGITPKSDFSAMNGGYFPNTHMDVTLQVGPDTEGVSSPNLRGQHTGSYKWTRIGNPDWYNINYVGVMYEFKTPDGTSRNAQDAFGTWYGPNISNWGRVPYTGGSSAYVSNGIMLENVYFLTSFQSHEFDTGSILSWGERPSVFNDNRCVSNEMCQNEALSYLDRYRNPISQIEIETYALPYLLGSMYTVNLDSEPNLTGLPGKKGRSFTMIENEITWSNNLLISKVTLTNLPGMRFPRLFNNFHIQPTLYSKDLINYIMPIISPSYHALGPPRYNG